MIKHFMLDLETMDTRPSAAIVSIGCVEFDLESRLVRNEFYTNVSLRSSMACGGTVDADTIMWWMSQTLEARSGLLGAQEVGPALADFNRFINSHVSDKGEVRMWANGSDFDNVILGNTYRRITCEPPWTFRNNRCYRTIRAANKHVPDIVRPGTAHNALDDAVWQANMLIAMIGGKDYE